MEKLSRRPIVILTSLLLVVSLALGTNIVFASGKLDWGDSGVLVSKDPGLGYEAPTTQMVSDKHGNVFLCWREVTSSYNAKTYVQKFTNQGEAAWKQPLLVAKYNLSLAYNNSVVATPDGGIIIVWTDNRNKRQPDIFAQKINADGTKAWSEDGVPIYVGPGYQSISSVICDNAGGAIVTWVDQERPGSFMQRIAPDGKTMWQDGGISLDTITGIESTNWPQEGPLSDNAYFLNFKSDNHGGFFVCWAKFPRSDYPEPFSYENTSTYMYLQRVDSSGAKAWQQSVEFKMTSSPYDVPPTEIAVTANGDATIARITTRYEKRPQPKGRYNEPYNPTFDMFIFKASFDGKILWTGEKPIFTTPKGGYINWQSNTVPSGNGAIVVFSIDEYPNDKHTDHLISLDASGTVAWHRQTPINPMYGPVTAKSDEKDGVFVASTLPPAKGSRNPSLLIQRFSKDGKALWAGNGIKAFSGQTYNSMYEADGAGGIFIAWRDYKEVKPKILPDGGQYYGPPQTDVYIQHIRDDGSGWPDVSADDWSYPFIDGLVKAGAIKGYNDGSFKPNGYITRAEFAKLAVIALGYDNLEWDPGETYFDHYDYNEIGKHWAKDYIFKAIKAGLMKGYYSPRKTVFADRYKSGPLVNMAFRPNARITRAEAAAIIFRAKNMQAAAVTQQFTDVPKSHWAFQYIDGLRTLDIAAGYGDNEFRPMNVISRKEAAKLIFKVMPGTQQ